MKPLEIKPGIYWVGGIDWNLRLFHGHVTPRGTTYNAYLIIDDKITLVDTVKYYMVNEMLDRIKEIIDPSRIDIVVSNHVEMDHSGGLPKIMELAPNAKVVTSPQGQKGLKRYYKQDNWDFIVVKSGEELNIGSRTLKFVHVPMVHWPDSMVTYIPEEKLLLPNDAFGQHMASTGRFDDEIGWDIVREAAAGYYSNIVLPYGENVLKALDVVEQLDIDTIAPSHGVIWRSYIDKILPVYRRWASNQTEPRALIVYDTIWESTKKIALTLQAGLEEAGVPVVVRFLQTSHISEVMDDLLESKAVLIGTPTLNNGMMPTVSALLTYMKGLRPKNRLGLAFGSYGWGGQGAREVAAAMQGMGMEMPLDTVNMLYLPDESEMVAVKEVGRKMGELILNIK
ncbi:Nitric oxide reductase [Sporotomaculum syntrophicum]|uniref:Nitric oxide reductase n=1 Tax=Sporotomaculum syntrophicum TaxID=182264 RepID=A0A9D2WPS4_9FIRM|nr:FprA family A-type flavoprotein [Sporotomaculum syntrophicum]KAF1084382.1 Nitric oxide reductase [Sporotomaculum syntrophicum]